MTPSTPPRLHQPPTVALAVKVSTVAILHFPLGCVPGKSARQVYTKNAGFIFPNCNENGN